MCVVGAEQRVGDNSGLPLRLCLNTGAPAPLSWGLWDPGEEAQCRPVALAEKEQAWNLLWSALLGQRLSPTVALSFTCTAREQGQLGDRLHSPHVSILDGPVVGGPGVPIVQHS